jgi:purine-binding chemotaxis protein CheW
METAAAGGTADVQFLTFHVGANEYALSLLGVEEIVACETITQVPTTPRFIRGVVNLRGSALPVVDLGAKFGLDGSVITRSSCIVVAEIASASAPATRMGLLVDAVGQVLEVAPPSIRAVPAFGPGVRLDYLAGMVEIDARFVLVLDLSRVLSTEEVLVVATVEDLRQSLELAAAADAAASAAESAPVPPATEMDSAVPVSTAPAGRGRKRRRGAPEKS